MAPGGNPVIRPGEWPRSRWETNGFSSSASPLVNCSNWQDAIKKEESFQHKWNGLVETDPIKQVRTGIWHELAKASPRRSRSGRSRSKTSSSATAMLDPSWDERVVTKLLDGTQKCAGRFAHSRRMEHARMTLKPRTINDSSAYRTPMPGYTGNRPTVRSRYENANKATAAELYTVTKRDFNGFDVPGLNTMDHAVGRDQHTDYRAQCSKYIGKCSPFCSELGIPVPKRLNMQMSSNEYIARTVDEIARFAAAAQ